MAEQRVRRGRPRRHDSEVDERDREDVDRAAPAAEHAATVARALEAGRPDTLNPSAVLYLQRAAGNRPVAAFLGEERSETSPGGVQRQAGPGPGAPRPGRIEISPVIEAQMKSHVDFIVGKLKEQVLTAGEESGIVTVVRLWQQQDVRAAEADPGYSGSDYLDHFLFLLKMRMFSRRTARTGWLTDEWLNAYDGLFFELEDDRLAAFRAITQTAHKQGTPGPGREQLESVYSYVGKREAMGGIGLLKSLGGALTKLGDAAIWARWKLLNETERQGLLSIMPESMKKALFPSGWDKGQAPTISEYVASQFDECAKLAAGGMGVDVNEKLFFGLSAYEFATIAGKIPAALMTAGASGTVEALDVVATIQTGVTSAENIARRVTELRKANPEVAWDVILFDSQVTAEFATLLGSALRSLGAFKEAFPPQVAASIRKWGLPVDIVTLVPDIQKAVAEYNDPTKTPEERYKIALDRAAEILGNLLGAIGKAHQERKEARATAAAGQP